MCLEAKPHPADCDCSACMVNREAERLAVEHPLAVDQIRAVARCEGYADGWKEAQKQQEDKIRTFFGWRP